MNFRFTRIIWELSISICVVRRILFSWWNELPRYWYCMFPISAPPAPSPINVFHIILFFNSSDLCPCVRFLVPKFYVLLTVHHAMILGKWPTWPTNSFLCIYFFIYNSVHVRAHRAHHQEINCINTTSGNWTVTLCWWLCRVQVGRNSQPAHDTATNTEWQLPEVVLIQFVSPDDEHDVLEICRE